MGKQWLSKRVWPLGNNKLPQDLQLSLTAIWAGFSLNEQRHCWAQMAFCGLMTGLKIP